MTEIYIIRHAESAGNSEGKLCGHINVDISEEGAKQLEYLAERFKNIKIDKIFTSPLLRAKKTAEAVNKHHGLEITEDDGLIELYCGILDGMKWTQIKSDYPEHYRIWREEPYNFAPPEGESQQHLCDRFCDAVLRLGRENDGKAIALSTHGGALRTFICRLGGQPLTELAAVPIVENTGVLHVRYEDGALTLIDGPDASHLPEELCTVGRQAEYAVKKK